MSEAFETQAPVINPKNGLEDKLAAIGSNPSIEHLSPQEAIDKLRNFARHSVEFDPNTPLPAGVYDLAQDIVITHNQPARAKFEGTSSSLVGRDFLTEADREYLFRLGKGLGLQPQDIQRVIDRAHYSSAEEKHAADKKVDENIAAFAKVMFGLFTFSLVAGDKNIWEKTKDFFSNAYDNFMGFFKSTEQKNVEHTLHQAAHKEDVPNQHDQHLHEKAKLFGKHPETIPEMEAMATDENEPVEKRTLLNSIIAAKLKRVRQSAYSPHMHVNDADHG